MQRWNAWHLLGPGLALYAGQYVSNVTSPIVLRSKQDSDKDGKTQLKPNQDLTHPWGFGLWSR